MTLKRDELELASQSDDPVYAGLARQMLAADDKVQVKRKDTGRVVWVTKDNANDPEYEKPDGKPGDDEAKKDDSKREWEDLSKEEQDEAGAADDREEAERAGMTKQLNSLVKKHDKHELGVKKDELPEKAKKMSDSELEAAKRDFSKAMDLAVDSDDESKADDLETVLEALKAEQKGRKDDKPGDEKAKKKEDKPKQKLRSVGKNDLIQGAGDSTVLLSEWAKGHIVGTHTKPGKGSVLSTDISLDDIQAAIAEIPASFYEGGGGVAEIKVPGAGHDLVHSVADIKKKYPNAREVVVEKEERGKKIKVKGFVVDNDIGDFATDTLSVVVRPTTEDSRQYLPKELQEDADMDTAIKDGKAHAVLSAWAGSSKIPPTSEWGDDYAVIIPNGGEGADMAEDTPPEKDESKKANMNLRQDLIRRASTMAPGPERTQLIQILALEHPSEEAKKKYLQEHPSAQRGNHSVKPKAKGLKKLKEVFKGKKKKKQESDDYEKSRGTESKKDQEQGKKDKKDKEDADAYKAERAKKQQEKNKKDNARLQQQDEDRGYGGSDSRAESKKDDKKDDKKDKKPKRDVHEELSRQNRSNTRPMFANMNLRKDLIRLASTMEAGPERTQLIQVLAASKAKKASVKVASFPYLDPRSKNLAREGIRSGLTKAVLRGGDGFALYKVDKGKNQSKFYEGMVTPDDSMPGTHRTVFRWGAMTDNGFKGRVDGKKFDEKFRGLTEAQAYKALNAKKRAKTGKGYIDTFGSKHVDPVTGKRLKQGEYPVGLARGVGFGWGVQEMAFCVPALRQIGEQIAAALDPNDGTSAIVDLKAALRLVSGVPDSNMAGKITKYIGGAMREINRGADPSVVNKRLFTIKNYIDKQVALCD